MTYPSPDAAAAAEHADPRVRELTEAHEGMTIEVLDPEGPPISGEVAFSEHDIPMGVMNIALRDLDAKSDFLTHLLVPLDTPFRMLSGPAEPLIRPVDTGLVRELTAVCDELKATEGKVKDLKRRKKEISDKLVEDYIANGLKSQNVGGRTSYLHTSTYAEYNERPAEEGGGKYTDADLIPVLHAIGRSELIKPQSVHSQTLASLLREFREAEKPLPKPLAKIVRLTGNPEVRVRS